ncbi:YihY/virulence factor BrkB family protein [Leucobacter sp. CSA1]|uniref:YihY/virulence factor BrkB family protein n=1 Tax=Leucobacter chromiisoli TaxID=2796471 RepID=A0A934QBM6_9MICO|nr:YihY/virulence factor BrkB family protein [Leucobacter chromiisoli]MBK0420112.1 YihY/virulence factor BrkB family protein [Leucobacter chromiisoli]
MTKPRDPDAHASADPGASSSRASRRRLLDARPPRSEAEIGRTRELIAEGRQRWQWARRTRVWRTVSRFTQVGGGVLSAGMSYQALFAVFAGLWLGFSVLGIWLRGRTELLDTLVQQLNLLVPGLIGDDGSSLVSLHSLLNAPAVSIGSVVAGASLAFVAVLWFTGTRRAIRIIFGLEVKEYRNWFLLKMRDLVLAVCFSLAILVSAGLTVVSSNLFDVLLDWLAWDPDSWIVGGLGTFARYAAMYVFDAVVLMAMFRFLAEIRVPRAHLLIGCALGAGVTFLLKIAGAAALGGASSNPLLASFAVFVGLLLWFNFICRALLLTASWIATGEDAELGRPEAPV